MPHRLFPLPLVIPAMFLFCVGRLGAAKVTAEQSPGGVTVKIDGQPFTEYLTRSGSKPILWPIFGPTGKPMTRAYPMQVDPRRNQRSSAPALVVVHPRERQRRRFLGGVGRKNWARSSIAGSSRSAAARRR